MDETIHALGAILLKAIPTVCFLLIVHLYLKYMFFRPLGEVLDKRREATEGARESARDTLAKAAEKTAAIEAALRKAREEIYQDQEETRRRWIVDQTNRLDEARRSSRELIHQARQELANETEAAKRELAATTDALAGQIADALLKRRTA